MSTAVFYSLSIVCQYLTIYRLLVLCHYVHCCLLQSVQSLSVPHNLPSVGSVSLCTLLSSTVCPQSVSISNLTSVGFVLPCPLLSSTVCLESVSTSQCTLCWFCVSVYTAVFYYLSAICMYFTLNRQLGLWHRVHCTLVHSVHYLSIHNTETSVGSVSLCPLLSSTISPMSVSISQCTYCWFYVTMSIAVWYGLSTLYQYITLFRL